MKTVNQLVLLWVSCGILFSIQAYFLVQVWKIKNPVPEDLGNGVMVTRYRPPKKSEYCEVNASYKIGAFKPDPKKYGYQTYDQKKAKLFLASIPREHYRIGDIIEVDGLKWIKENMQLEMKTLWKPFPNPPVPILEEKEEPAKHLKEYAQWIDDHPHFGLPPLPMSVKE